MDFLIESENFVSFSSLRSAAESSLNIAGSLVGNKVFLNTETLHLDTQPVVTGEVGMIDVDWSRVGHSHFSQKRRNSSNINLLVRIMNV